MCVNHLGSGCSTPREAFRCRQPSWCPTMTSGEIPTPNYPVSLLLNSWYKGTTRNNKYLFRPLGLGGICYVTFHKQYRKKLRPFELNNNMLSGGLTYLCQEEKTTFEIYYSREKNRYINTICLLVSKSPQIYEY